MASFNQITSGLQLQTGIERPSKPFLIGIAGGTASGKVGTP